MEEPISNVRPLAIFSGYMALAAALTATCIVIIVRGSGSDGSVRRTTRDTARRPPTSTVALFSGLAAASLAMTWYHMFMFFRWSYQQWAAVHSDRDPDVLHLGEWLRDTALFKQAWASTLETAPRAWWSLQILGFCALWSVMLAVQQKRRNIPFAWAFMLLGQVVAISFASNLFFLAVLLRQPSTAAASPRRSPARSSSKASTAPYLSAEFWHSAIIAIDVSLAVSIPPTFGKPIFMRLVLGSHALAFAPLVLNAVLHGRGDGASTASSSSTYYAKRPSNVITLATMATLLYSATAQLYAEGGDVGVAMETLHRHPAVSSVGWDVICCWVSFAAWHLFGEV